MEAQIYLFTPKKEEAFRGENGRIVDVLHGCSFVPEDALFVAQRLTFHAAKLEREGLVAACDRTRRHAAQLYEAFNHISTKGQANAK